MIYDADLNGGFFNSLRYLNKYYGITQDPITEDFIIIMKYYKLGSLKDYMTKNFYNIKWIEKLKILQNIVDIFMIKRLFIEIFIVEIFFVMMKIIYNINMNFLY